MSTKEKSHLTFLERFIYSSTFTKAILWYDVRHKIRNYSLNKTVDVMCYLALVTSVLQE